MQTIKQNEEHSTFSLQQMQTEIDAIIHKAKVAESCITETKALAAVYEKNVSDLLAKTISRVEAFMSTSNEN